MSLDRSLRPILAPATLGMLGGGQLGRYFVLAAHELGYEVWVLDPDESSPAGRIADRHLCTGYDDPVALGEMAANCAAVTTEFENVPAATLERLAGSTIVRPRAAAVASCQDRIVEKTFLADNGLPIGPVAFIRNLGDLENADDSLFPAVMKRARFGYDGRGQAIVGDRAAALAAFERLGRVDCVLEKKLPLDRELSVVLARGVDGTVECFATVENRHRNGILDVTIAPAAGSAEQIAEAQELATRIATALDYVGVLGVELFVSDGVLLINELAPRPHNSGHVTIDSTVTSQFEQQVRALCGLPLGSTAATRHAVMVNLLGELWDDGALPPWPLLLADGDLKVHLYGKAEARPGRKMGHLTVLGEDPEETLTRALAARAAAGID